MKKLMTLGLLATSFVFSNEVESIPETEDIPVQASYGYVSVGLGLGLLPVLKPALYGIPMPLLGVGGRFQKGHHGFDGSIHFTSFGGGMTITKENLNYLHYFNPNLASQLYVGGGVGMTEFWYRGGADVLLSPQMVIGKQYTNKSGNVRYFQMQLEPVFLDLSYAYKKGRTHVVTLPAVVLSYGICF